MSDEGKRGQADFLGLRNWESSLYPLIPLARPDHGFFGFGLAPVGTPDALVVAVRQLERPHGVMRQHAVLCHERRRQSLGVAEEETIVPHAQPEDDVQLAARAV